MIRDAGKKDLAECSKLIQETILRTNARYYNVKIIERWKERVSLPQLLKGVKESNFIIYEENNRILGFGSFKESKIESIYVHPDFQTKGIGSSMIRYAEQKIKERGFNMIELNATSNALDFYKKLGYHENGEATIMENGLTVRFTKMSKSI